MSTLRRRSSRHSRLTAVLLLVTLGACSAPSHEQEPTPAPPTDQPSTVPASPGYLSTADGDERVTSLPVGPRATSAGKRVVYSQRVDLHEGEALLSLSEFQVTNDLGTNVYVGSMLLLGTSATSITGREISAANGENVTPGMHHGQQTKNGTYRVGASDVGVRYVNLVAWAAASRSSPGDQISVDQGYGKLSVLTW